MSGHFRQDFLRERVKLVFLPVKIGLVRRDDIDHRVEFQEPVLVVQQIVIVFEERIEMMFFQSVLKPAFQKEPAPVIEIKTRVIVDEGGKEPELLVGELDAYRGLEQHLFPTLRDRSDRFTHLFVRIILPDPNKNFADLFFRTLCQRIYREGPDAGVRVL